MVLVFTLPKASRLLNIDCERVIGMRVKGFSIRQHDDYLFVGTEHRGLAHFTTPP